jgi:hypothetical protein
LYGLALPLLKVGVPLGVVQLENMTRPECLKPYDVVLLTYEHQKPLEPDYHEALAHWVREGGCLICVGDGSDPYHRVREWWNDQGKTEATAYDDLFDRLSVTADANNEPQRVGKGHVRVLLRRPSDLQQSPEGAATVRALVAEMLRLRGHELDMQNYLLVQRGPFVVASVLDESTSDAALTLEGPFVDLFDPTLPVLPRRRLGVGERALLYDLHWARSDGAAAKVVAAGTRVRHERLEGDRFSFIARGPRGTTANARLILPAPPVAVSLTPSAGLSHEWDNASRTLWLSFPNRAEDLTVLVRLGDHPS